MERNQRSAGDYISSVVLQFVNVLGWMVVIYLMLFIIIGGDFSISIKWENLRDFWDVLNGI